MKQNKIVLVSATHLILRFFIVQNKLQQTNETMINHINDNHIKFEVSLHFGEIWPTVGRLYPYLNHLIEIMLVDF